jgi:hypothetical protein
VYGPPVISPPFVYGPPVGACIASRWTGARESGEAVYEKTVSVTDSGCAKRTHRLGLNAREVDLIGVWKDGSAPEAGVPCTETR